MSEPALTLISLLSAGQSSYISTCLRIVYPPSPLEAGNVARAMGAAQQMVHIVVEKNEIKYLLGNAPN